MSVMRGMAQVQNALVSGRKSKPQPVFTASAVKKRRQRAKAAEAKAVEAKAVTTVTVGQVVFEGDYTWSLPETESDVW
jgi:hypothetical protein